jgi:type III secretion system YscD/HrpQ family protein
MAGYFVAEEGPLSGLIIRFEEGDEWVLGRDPDEAGVVLEDPMVSRKHVIIRLTPEGFFLENLSAVNPATQNGKVIAEPIHLREGDILQIGSTFFRFTEKDPFTREEEFLPQDAMEEPQELSEVTFDTAIEHTRWLLKVISGPNAGAEFNMQKSSTYMLGKDPNLCDIVFQDLSVSRQHARLTVDDHENVFIEDLGSRNGVLVNGELIEARQQISSQDLIALGTTTFLIIDRHEVRETIISPPALMPQKAEPAPTEEELAAEEAAAPKDWREMVIPKRHLFMAGGFAVVLLVSIFALFSLFKGQAIVVHEKDESGVIEKAIHGYHDVQFAYTQGSGKLFLVGHVLTPVEKQELLYTLNSLPFLTDIEDNVVIDEYVWQNMNALLVTNPAWQGISVHSPAPGRFVMRGYLQTLEQLEALNDYVNVNFSYLDRLENQVVVEGNLSTQIQGALVTKGFSGVTFQLGNGELVLSGRADEDHTSSFNELVKEFKAIPGIRLVKNFVVFTTADTSRIDLSSQFHVTGYSRKDEKDFYVVINGKILSVGDTLDGMNITGVLSNMVLLEKDGLKFKINYNLQ